MRRVQWRSVYRDAPPALVEYPEALRRVPMRADLERSLGSIVAGVLHPGRGGPLNVSVPSEPELRRRAERFY